MRIENVSLSSGASPSPILSLNATLKTATGNNHTAMVQWDVSFEDTNIKSVLNALLLQFSPSVPECGYSCSLARDTGPLTAGQMSVTLEVGTRYEVEARAESCGGDLSSPWSDPLTIHLQGMWNTTCQLQHYILLLLVSLWCSIQILPEIMQGYFTTMPFMGIHCVWYTGIERYIHQK